MPTNNYYCPTCGAGWQFHAADVRPRMACADCGAVLYPVAVPIDRLLPGYAPGTTRSLGRGADHWRGETSVPDALELIDRYQMPGPRR